MTELEYTNFFKNELFPEVKTLIADELIIVNYLILIL